MNNELYRGWITYNRQRFVKDPDTGRGVARPNPENEWVTKEVPTLRLVDDDLWNRVQKIKQRYSSRWGNKRQTKKRLLSGLLRCGRCGGGMTTSKHDRYYCSARREKGTCDANRGIEAAELEVRVLNGLTEILLDNEHLIREFVIEFKREATRLRRGRLTAAHQLDKELQQVERGIKRCLEFITGGDGDPGSVRDQLRKLEDRKGELASALAASKHADPVELHPNLPNLYRRKVTALRRMLDVENTRAQAIDIIRSLIDHIEINRGKEPGQCEVVVVGGLAQILAFAQQKTTAASQGDGGTFVMVAGTRSHLYRTCFQYERTPR